MNNEKFNLEIKIAAFIQQLNEDGIITEIEQDELWDHFYSKIEDYTTEGLTNQEAFEKCVHEFGSASIIRQEYRKERPKVILREYVSIGIVFWFFVALLELSAHFISNILLTISDSILHAYYPIHSYQLTTYTLDIYLHFLPFALIGIVSVIVIGWKLSKWVLTDKRVRYYAPFIMLGILVLLILMDRIFFIPSQSAFLNSNITRDVFAIVMFIFGTYYIYKHRTQKLIITPDIPELSQLRTNLLIGLKCYFGVYILCHIFGFFEAIIVRTITNQAISSLSIGQFGEMVVLLQSFIIFLLFIFVLSRLKRFAATLYQYDFILPVISLLLFIALRLGAYLEPELSLQFGVLLWSTIEITEIVTWFSFFVYTTTLTFLNHKKMNLLTPR